MTEAGPLVQLQISLSRVPWRLAPAWSVLAGAFAAGRPLDDPTLWLRVVAAVVLGDLAWGVLRRYVTAPGSTSSTMNATLNPGLPYAQPESPMGLLVRELSVDGGSWHGVMAGVILAFGGALLLGLPALALSMVAVVVTAVAWALARRGDTPAACLALLDVFLPFSLGLLAVGWTVTGRGVLVTTWQPLLVAAAFTLLHWGALRRALASEGKSLPGLGLGVLAVLVALIGLGMPWAAAVCAVLLVPALYWLGSDSSAPVTALAWPWFMLAMFVAALALR